MASLTRGAAPDHEFRQVQLTGARGFGTEDEVDFLSSEWVWVIRIRESDHDAVCWVVRGPVPSSIQPEDLPQVADDLSHRLVVQLGHERVLHPVLNIQVVDAVGLAVTPARSDVGFHAAGVASEAAGGDLVAFDIEPEVDVMAEGVAFHPG